ncbi:hypothetical protein [Sorangium sp. So ce861]|uniref:hypothetical protein n=1 Tax=Sorangium sp. So ce861 TaxID=3133323 RepID=UPI003F6304CF
MRRVRRAVIAGAAVARLSLPGSAAAQEARAPGWEESESREDVAQRRERAALLSPRFNDAIRMHSSTIVLPILFSGLGAATLAASLSSDMVAPQQITFIAGSATMLAGGLAAFAVPETYRPGTLGAAGLLYQGSLWLGFALDEDHELARITPVALSAGFYVAGLLSGLNLALSEYTPVSRLRADYALLATPASRAGLSGAQVASIERDLLGTAPAIPSWAIYLPVALGGVVATVPAWDGDLPVEKRLLSVTSGVLNAGWSLIAMDLDPPAKSYERDLRRAGLRVAPSGPDGTAGVTVSGKF